MAAIWVSGGSTVPVVPVLALGISVGAVAMGSPVGDFSVPGSRGSAGVSAAHAARDTVSSMPAIPTSGFNIYRVYPGT